MASWREQIAFAPLESVERGEEIGRRIRHAIELGVLEDGAQLPSESDLAARMGVSAMTLRAALAGLRDMGLLETRRGKGGGSFVRANTGDIARVQRDTLAEYSVEGLRDIREYRAFLAGSAAAAAAGLSQQIAIGRLASMAAMIETAHNPAEMTPADSRFHIELASMSGSVLLTRQEMAMQAEVGALVWIGAPDRRGAAAKEHAAIVEAIRVGDAVRARAVAEDHVREDMNRLIDLRMSMDAPPSARPPSKEGIDRAISAVKAFAASLQEAAAASIRAVEGAVHVDLDRATRGGLGELTQVYDVARRNVARFEPDLYGTGFIADPSFFGETGMIWCYTPSGPESAQRMEMDAEFYDFSTAPWWPAPDTRDTVRVSRAFVSATSSNEHLVLFVKRVLRDGRMAGVAGASVLVSRLQAGFDPFLWSLPPKTCVVDHDDVVIATNTASLLGRTISQSHRTGRRIELPSVPWRLSLGPSNGERD